MPKRKLLTKIGSPKRVSVIGAERSGIAAAALLKSLGVQVFISDIAKGEKATALIAKLSAMDIEYEIGSHSDRIYFDTDLIVTSPGVDSRSELFAQAHKKLIPVWTELELAWRLNPGKTLAITGTNGKSTVTAWLGSLFTEAGIPNIVAGNIGTALSTHVLELTEKHWAIVEVSSFQLEWIHQFAPDVAVILNLAPDHQNRYDSLQSYYVSKRGITRNQTEQQVLVLNHDDRNIGRIFQETRAQKIEFSSSHPLQRGVWLGHDRWYLRDNEAAATSLATFQSVQLAGRHNLLNGAAVAAAAYAAGIPAETITRAMPKFSGLPHRLQLIPTSDGIRWFNDSKATTVDSAKVALMSFSKSVIWLVGGYDKQMDYASIRKLASKRVKQLIAFGAAGEVIADLYQSTLPVVRVGKLFDAVKEARKIASDGDIVLLSPMCASFDEFRDYEDRGEQFAHYVMEHAE